jgi:hypothetical protein
VFGALRIGIVGLTDLRASHLCGSRVFGRVTVCWDELGSGHHRVRSTRLTSSDRSIFAPRPMFWKVR